MRHLRDERNVRFNKTQPKSSAFDIRSPRPRSLVHTDDASAYGTPLAFAIASSSCSKVCTVMTGPKISCWMSSSGSPPEGLWVPDQGVAAYRGRG